MLATDLDNTITNFNDPFARMLGYENRHELRARSFPELCAPVGTHICSTGELILLDAQYQRQQVQYVNRLLQSGTASTRVYLLRKDGIVMPADATASLLTNDSGEHAGILTVFADATQRLEAEQQKKETDFFLDIFAAARDGIYVSDGLGKCIMANQAFCEMTGYAQQELIGAQGPSLLPDSIDDRESEQTVRAMSADSDILFFRTMWRHKNGSIFPVEVNLAVLKDARGDDNGIVATVRDVTERLKAEQEAVSEKTFFENIFIYAREGMYVTDAEGHFVLVNQAFCDLTGCRREELLGRYVPEMLPFDPEYTVEDHGVSRTQDDFSCFETRWKRRDGTVYMAEVRLSELKTVDNETSGMVGIVCDTTARKQLELELKARVRERTDSFEEMNKALTVLLRVRDEDRQALLEKISASVSGLVLPYLEKLKASRLTEHQRSTAAIMEANLKEMIAPFAMRAVEKFHSFTPAELKVANLIKQGFKTKDIAQISGLSSRTIDHTRESIRTKLGIFDRKISLSAYLLSCC